MSRTERMTLDWQHYFETGKFRMVASTYKAECGCKQCRSAKSIYKRLNTKKSRQEGKALVQYEMTNPEVEPRFAYIEPRVVLQDRKGYSSLDCDYFEMTQMREWYEAQYMHRNYAGQLSAEGRYSTQSKKY